MRLLWPPPAPRPPSRGPGQQTVRHYSPQTLKNISRAARNRAPATGLVAQMPHPRHISLTKP